jgi:hypothetical protein
MSDNPTEAELTGDALAGYQQLLAAAGITQNGPVVLTVDGAKVQVDENFVVTEVS